MIWRRWRIYIQNRNLCEQIFIWSFLFIFVILSFDCWFQNLPLSGYGIIFICSFIVGCISVGLRYEIESLLLSTKQEHKFTEDVGSNWYLKYVQGKENYLLDKLSELKVTSLDCPATIEEQIRLLLKDIEKDYVKNWYAEISTNPSFLFDCHLFIEEFFCKLLARCKCISWKHVLKYLCFIYVSHLQEYKRSLRRAKSSKAGEIQGNKEISVDKFYRCTHPAGQSDRSLNHYLINVIQILFQEYVSHEFSTSLEGSIVTNILSRKLLKTLLVNIEDPLWLYIKMLYAIDEACYISTIQDKSYLIYEVTEVEPVIETLPKFRIATKTSDITSNIFDRTIGSKVFMNKNGGQKKEVMSLPLAIAKPDSNISSVLGNLISSTAAPLLPDNASLCYQPLNKMWLSPVTELKQEITDTVVTPLIKTLSEGFNHDGLLKNGLFAGSKTLTRSKSSDAVSPSEEVLLPRRDISVGEDLSEATFIPEESGRRLVKTRSFDAGSNGDLPLDEGKAGDVSPVYEEPEDFATTIAKLRSVLQQRESTSTISDKSNDSMDSYEVLSKENTFDLGEKGQSMTEGLSPESHVACDIPTDGRPFVNIFIPRTEVHESSNSSYVLYTIQYDGIYVKQTSESGSQLVLQTTIVKRRFQEFLNLQTRLEENSSLRQHLKGIKGPTKWMNLQFNNKTDDATTASRRPVLESYLQQLCSKPELATSQILQEFFAYGSNAVTAFSSKSNTPSLQKIDKFFSTKVSGVFNSIKTALPSFEPTSLLSPALDAKEVKPLLEPNLLQGFLNFGSKSEDLEISVNYVVNDATGTALSDDIRYFLTEKSDCVEDAFDVLDNSDWHSDEGECHVAIDNTCAWLKYRDGVIDDNLDKFDQEAPILNLLVDILCELLETPECWLTKEPVVHIIKAFAKKWEIALETILSKINWSQVCGNLIRLLRLSLFSPSREIAGDLNVSSVRSSLQKSLTDSLPDELIQIIGPEAMNAAVTLFLDSLQQSRYNRDVLLRVLDFLVTQLLSCPHLQL